MRSKAVNAIASATINFLADWCKCGSGREFAPFFTVVFTESLSGLTSAATEKEFFNELTEEVEERAMKQVLALQLAELLKSNRLTKSEMAARMKTSRAAVDRLLDADNPSVTLTTLGKAARALGRNVKIELVPA